MLNSVQNNPKVSGTLAKQIVDLSLLQNGMKLYTELTQISAGFTKDTSIVDVYTAMQNNSIAMYLIAGANTVYPFAYGQVLIYKSIQNRDSIEALDATTNKKYIGTCHSNYEGGFSGWLQIATTDITDTLDRDCLKKVIIMPQGTSVKACYENGIYKSFGWLDYPSELVDGQGTLVVTNHAGESVYGWVEQEFITPHVNERFISAIRAGEFSGWEKIAKTTMTRFTCTPNAGYKVSNQFSYFVGKEFVVTLAVSKEDDTTFGSTSLTPVSFPSGVSPTTSFIGTATGSVSTASISWQKTVNTYCTSAGNIAVTGEQLTSCARVYLQISGRLA